MSSASVAHLPCSVSVVELVGEFDMINVSDAVTALDQVIADDATRTVAVDLSGVTFLDSTMLQALINARDRAQLARKPVWLVRPPAPAWRIFEATLLDRLFRDFSSIQELAEYAASTEGVLST
jgi:anti-anti-sigma factor